MTKLINRCCKIHNVLNMSLQPAGTFVNYICSKKNDSVIYLVRYTTYCYFFSCGPQTSPLYRVWSLTIKRLETHGLECANICPSAMFRQETKWLRNLCLI